MKGMKVIIPLNISFPFQSKQTLLPSKFATLDWNPLGHEPEGIFDVPHFDFHFYMISNQERLSITPLAPTEMDPEIPLAKYMPAGYIQLPGRVSKYGCTLD
jgi:hypothetical protein